MKLKWLGHSCFLLTFSNGMRILTDPFDSHIGFGLPEVEADIVTTSHGHGDHNYIKAVKGNFSHLSNRGIYNINCVGIKAIPTFHDEAGGKKRGENLVFVFDMDGLKVCHCGDLGHLPTTEQQAEIGKVDVLLVPVGSVYTIDAESAARVVELLKPAVTIPMHFKTPDLNLPLDGVGKFITAAGSGFKAGRQEIEVTRENLHTYPKVLILEYKSL